MVTFKGKTVLITGATGLIGSHIVDELMEMGDVNVIALSRNEKKLREGFEKYLEKENFMYIAQDIASGFDLNDRIDYIFHAAGPMEGKIIKEYPVDVINPNIMGTIHLLEYLKNQEKNSKVKGRMVLFSSVTVYGNITDKDSIVEEKDTDVTEVLESISAPYSQSKRMSEVIALAYLRQYGVDTVIARFSTVYGCTRFLPDTAFYEFIRKAVSGEDIVLNGSAFPKRDNIYIDDAVSGVLTACLNGKAGEAYNISSNGDLCNYAAVDEIAEKIVEICNKKNENILHTEEGELLQHAYKRIKVRYNAGKFQHRKSGIRLDNSKLKRLGWNISTSINQGIDRTIEQIYRKEYCRKYR